MGIPKRIYYENAVYHITIRGNNKQSILQHENDKKSFLESVEKYRARFRFKLFAFVIMDNHVHLIIAANNKINISKIMQAIILSYSKKFRNKYTYTGYVWEGRFKSKIIEQEKYIIDCINYIHNNPVRAGITNNLNKYIWSSYHIYQAAENKLKGLIGIDKFDF